MTARRVSIVGLILVLSACRTSDRPSPAGRPRCDPSLSVPASFDVTGRAEDPSPTHIGVRIDLRADDGRELHYFSGIPGEFGEGLGGHGNLRMADGSRGVLSGEGTTWVLEWPGDPPCAPLAVLGTGMDAGRFRDALRSAGALAPQ